MKDLNTIVRENAELALERAQTRAAAKGQKFDKADLARSMARRMEREPGKKPWTDSTIYRTLTEFMSGNRVWRLDFLEAFCSSVQVPPERIVADDYDDKKIPEADYAQYLSRALGRRLKPKQATRIVENLNKELDVPGMFELVAEIAETILDTPDQGAAELAVSEKIRRSKIWQRHPQKAGTIVAG